MTAFGAGSFIKFIKWCLGELHARSVYYAGDNTIQQIRFKALFLMALLISVSGVILSSLQILAGNVDTLFVNYFLCGNLLVALAMFILWSSGSLPWATFAVIGPIISVVLFAAYYNGGGILNPHSMILAVVPLFVSFLLGMRAAFVAAAAAFILMLGLYYARVLQVVPLQTASDNARMLESALMTATIMLMTTCIGGAFIYITRQAQQQLEVAREHAEHANIAKSQFLATMSHEIRTPLNSVLGFTNLLLQGEDDKERRDQLKTVKTSGEALLVLLNDILDLSKIEAGALELEDTEFDFSELMNGVMNLTGPNAHGRGIELGVYVAPDVPQYLMGDPGRVRQILLNLIGNAIKFTDHGGISVIASVREQVDGRFVKLDIRDTGVGIDANILPHLFDKFTQADASTTRRYGGTGLGLAICKELTELMGGAVSATSTLGVGSCFSIRLPLKDVAEHPPRIVVPPQFSGIRILVVDDNEINLTIFRMQLEAVGIEVSTLINPCECLPELDRAISSGHPYDIIILDHLMPEMDGVALATVIIEKLPKARLILSSSSDMIQKNDLHAKGFAAIVPKPVYQDRLYFQIARLLGLSELEAEYTDSHAEDKGIVHAENKSKRILLVEDNAANQLLATKILETAGHSVDVASDGVEAIDATRQRLYDIILMDIQMPNMNGVDATRRIRSSSGAAQDTPIIALTANAMKGDRETYLAAGMNDYVSKPINFNDLFEKLEKWTRTKSYASAPPPNEDAGPPVNAATGAI